MQAGRQEQAVMSVRRKVISGLNDGKAGLSTNLKLLWTHLICHTAVCACIPGDQVLHHLLDPTTFLGA